MMRFVVGMLSVGLMVLGAGEAFSQSYPNKPIRVLTSSAGGPADFAARLIAQGISGGLGQPVIIDNRSGIIPAVTLSKAAPDGYTLLSSGSNVWITPLMQVVPYDPTRDFSPISLAAVTPLLLVVYPALPVKSVKDLIALAKARPGELNYASSVIGTPPNLAAELFKAMAGVNIVFVPYKGGAAAFNDLIAGRMQLMFPNAALAVPNVKSGRVRALAVTTAKPSSLFPDLPTVGASGLPGYESASTHGVFAPARTPASIINRVNQEILRVLSRAEVKERFLDDGTEVVGSSPQEFAVAMKAEMARIGRLVKDNGIRTE